MLEDELDYSVNAKEEKKYFIVNEKLQVRGTYQNTRIRKQTLFDATAQGININYSSFCEYFRLKDSPVSDFGLKIKDDTIIYELHRCQKERFESNSGFLVSNEVIELLKGQSNKQMLSDILSQIKLYGRKNFYVISNYDTGTINHNTLLPVYMWGDEYEFLALETLEGRKTALYEESYLSFSKSIIATNIVLSQIIPGLSLEISNIEECFYNERKGIAFDLFSLRGENKIPISCESDGVRRIISIANILIAAYNDKSVTFVIDELDSGIYEYLLGELLKILADSGRGQLIFTSHNLRPLEVLPSKYICFTTTNPEKRFVKLKTSGNNNLRDCYYKNIILGSDEEQLYMPTDNYEIEMALYEAGRILHTEEE